jgi:hypothetical protein
MTGRGKTLASVLSLGLLFVAALIFVLTRQGGGISGQQAQYLAGQGLGTPNATLQAAATPHRIADIKITDTIERRQIELSATLSEIPTREEIERLLFRLEAACENLHEFTNTRHIYGPTQPTHIWIRLYPSDEHLETYDAIVAMLGRTPGNLLDPEDYNVRLTIFEDRIAALLGPPEELFGMTEQERMAIYRELWEADRRAQREAESVHPLPEVGDPEYLSRHLQQADYIDSLLESYKDEIAQRHITTKRVLGEISGEGIRKGWPH